MSLRSYLFSLIGGLILLFTLVQLALLYWLEQNIQQDVDHKVMHINEKALALTLDKVFVTDELQEVAQPKNVTAQKHVNSDNKNVANNNIEIIKFTGGNGETPHTIIELDHEIPAGTNHIDKKKLTTEFKIQIEKILKQENITVPENANSTVIIKDNKVQQHWITEVPLVQESKTAVLITSIKYSLMIGAIIALFFAYWLSVQFNKPLKQLSLGFKQLSQGNYKKSVKVQGVKEIRTTIGLFNAMVLKLDQLSQAEKHHKEIAHLAELGEVSRGLAHTLRNPIHTIGLSIDQLQNNELNIKQKEHLLTTVQQKISTLDKSIKALLTLTTTGIIRNDTIPLLAVIQDIMLEYKTDQVNTLRFDLSVDAKTTIVGAESEIRSVLHTLIINACEASPENGTISINAITQNNSIIITVTDQGQGINKSITEHLFQPHISTKPEGAGMGLYIANRIISLHYNGHLTLKNNIKNEVITGCIARALFSLEPIKKDT